MKKKLLAILFIIGLAACNTDLSIRQDFDFEVVVLPYYTTISANEQVELRLEIRGVDGSYENTEYFMRYFQYTGKGSLVNEDGVVFSPNDSYKISNKSFRFYFTPSVGQTHQLELTFFDSFRHEHILIFNFTLEETKANN